MNISNVQKILLGSFLLFTLALVLYLSTNEEKSEEVIATNKKQETLEKKQKEIEIIYLKDEKTLPTETKQNTTTSDAAKHIKTTQVIERDFTEEKSIEAYIQQEKLIDINEAKGDPLQQPPRFSIYATVSKKDAIENRDKSIPPPAPMITTVTFPSGERGTVVIPQEIYNQSSQLLVTNNNSEGTANEATNLKEDASAQDVNLIAPPTPGS